VTGVVGRAEPKGSQTGPRVGRRAGAPDTRRQILVAARRCFASKGYDAATMRLIAADAAVDPALLVHYFGTKEALFVEAVGFPINPSELFSDLAPGDVGATAEAIVRRFLQVVDHDRSRNAVLALVRSVVSSERAASMLREFVTSALLRVMSSFSRHEDAELRASLVAAQLVGIAMLRHVVKLKPLAKASHDELVPLVSATVARYLA
jgi:AcrR family transcriptional regulator